MDGECDVRKVTVSHFLLVASDTAADRPSTCGERSGGRYISALWPGAIGVQSGFNSAGLWCASNAGSPKPAPFLEGSSNGGPGHPLNAAAIQHLIKAPLAGIKPTRLFLHFLYTGNGRFTKTGSGQTWGTLQKRRFISRSSVGPSGGHLSAA